MSRPEVIPEAGQIKLGERLAVTFHRTLRVPADGRRYPLPAGLGTLPVFAVAGLEAGRRPVGMGVDDVLVPLHQQEALWIGIHAAAWRPNVLKVAVGGINAVSGRPETGGLSTQPQDYLVCPPQLWLDGVNTGPETVRQFVASRIGEGKSVESALTGREKVGGLQLTAFEPISAAFPDAPAPPPQTDVGARMRSFGRQTQKMGIAAGGEIDQKIYPDQYGLATWDQDSSTTTVVHLVEASDFVALTGGPILESPITEETYRELGIPWFRLDDEALGDIKAPVELAHLPEGE